MELTSLEISTYSISLHGYLGDIYLPWHTVITVALIAGAALLVRKIKKAR
jgi:hypothetical protein